MSLVKISSPSQWQSLLADTNVVVADFYADWCGPCKTIAPLYERLAKEHSQPKKVAFAKINVDEQKSIAQSLDVRAMPTFKIFRGGNCVDTIKGANPSALSEAVAKAVRMGGAAAKGAAFGSSGRTLGGDGGGRGRSLAGGSESMVWDFNNWINTLIVFFGLYFTTLFTVDAYKAAEQSKFNVRRSRIQPVVIPGSGTNGTRAAAAKPAGFKTLADLGSE